jgi:U3 small nucleolar RNA-associated protein 23
MKVKKQKRHRKSLTFYTACFGFHKPYRVLCDGTFIRHLIVNRITPADTALASILSAPVKLYTTRSLFCFYLDSFVLFLFVNLFFVLLI